MKQELGEEKKKVTLIHSTYNTSYCSTLKANFQCSATPLSTQQWQYMVQTIFSLHLRGLWSISGPQLCTKWESVHSSFHICETVVPTYMDRRAKMIRVIGNHMYILCCIVEEVSCMLQLVEVQESRQSKLLIKCQQINLW